jgi:hypothetical protein
MVTVTIAERALSFRTVFFAAFFATLALLSSAAAHEARPAYMEVTEIAPHHYQIVWRTPLLSGMRLPVALRFSENICSVTEPTLREFSDSLIERRPIESDSELIGTRIEIVGLQATITDVLVRV